MCTSCSNGECVAPNNCSCFEGYESSYGICRPICNTTECINGYCSAPSTCKCFTGYEMINGVCTLYCEPECINGKCNEDNQCECNPGFQFDGNTSNICIDPVTHSASYRRVSGLAIVGYITLALIVISAIAVAIKITIDKQYLLTSPNGFRFKFMGEDTNAVLTE